MIISCSRDRYARIWNTDVGAELLVQIAHS
jgi:hypothetical protein